MVQQPAIAWYCTKLGGGLCLFVNSGRYVTILCAMKWFLSFDPLLFLGLTNLKDEERGVVSQKLLGRISQYIAIRIVELLSEEDLKNIGDDPQKLFSLAKQKIPDLENKVKLFLEDFKREFNNNLKQV